MTAAFLSAQSILKAFASEPVRTAGITLDAIEIGNEADLYSHQNKRVSTYDISRYVQEWVTFATNISDVMGITLNSSTRFWGCSFAGSSLQASGFGPQSAFSQDLLSSKPGAAISTISQHHYSGSFCTGDEALLQNLMTKSTIRSNLTMFVPDIQATRTNGLDYILGETNSYSCNAMPFLLDTYFSSNISFPGCTRGRQRRWSCVVGIGLSPLRVTGWNFSSFFS